MFTQCRFNGKNINFMLEYELLISIVVYESACFNIQEIRASKLFCDYRKDPKFSYRKVWENNVDTDQPLKESSLIRV